MGIGADPSAPTPKDTVVSAPPHSESSRTGTSVSSARRRLASRGDVTRWWVATGLVAGAVLVLVLVAGGGAPQPSPAGLPDAGALTGWALPASRLLADLAGIATLGLLMAAGFLLPSPATGLRWVPFLGVRVAARAALVWALAVLAEILLTVSDILGRPVDKALQPSVVRSFLLDIPQGRALAVQLLLALVLAAVARSTSTNRGATLAAGLALLTLAPPAFTGHSSASGSHDLAVASLLVHVLAASVWVGGLVALAWAAAQGEGMRLAVPRFSVLAAWCFVAVGLSGVVNAGVRLGAVGPLFTSSYGVLVLAKTLALVTLGGFGWWQRRRIVGTLAARSTNADARGDTRIFLRLAAAELVLMAATVALAVGLSRTPTPAGAELDTSPATELLGFALPPAPDAQRLLLGWTANGFAVTFIVLAAALYLTGLRQLHRRGVPWPVGRTLAWFAGLLVVGWATVGGLGLYSHVLFSAHMVSHMLLSMVAPIGLVLGAPVTLALRTLPGPRVKDEAGPRQLLLGLLHSGPVQVVSHPLVALALWVGSLYALYFTPIFGVLMNSHLGHVAMELHFLAVGSLFFWTLIGIDPTPRRWHPLARIGLLLAAMPFHAFFSIALLSSDTVLDAAYYRALQRPYSTDLLADQHLGGGIGWALSELPIILVVGAIFTQWVRADHREAVRLDRSADRAQARRLRPPAQPAAAAGTDSARAPEQEVDELSAYNEYLARLGARDRRP
jgi:cytochrome c oxidase assembly factor CtaG/putative copper export protein